MGVEREKVSRKIARRPDAAVFTEAAASLFPTKFFFFPTEVPEKVFFDEVNRDVYIDCAGAFRYPHFFYVFVGQRRKKEYQCRSPPQDSVTCQPVGSLEEKEDVRKEILFVYRWPEY